ncbi:DUF5009 domain-containing protein [Bacteroides sp. HF-5092]|uniref:DUF5009 domain-containing protein n=1 Tax=Bacteroides TaxID=816 RepID=UPI0011783919|nr:MULTISPECIES: DUF5009 domain-containing protein [Bacteroides]TRX46809.1 DUF5009 domain-containing protein [Bacteroides sp. HF-5092]
MTDSLTIRRASSLDALRGIAIFGMILSGTIASGMLPAWMYHAQVGPRSQFTFDPSIYGITWVDLVFPFFLFAMGAAFPFSIGRKLEKGVSCMHLSLKALLRGIRLTFFAIFIQHMYPWIINDPEDMKSWGISLFSFILMFPIYMRFSGKYPQWLRITIEYVSYGIGILMLLLVPYANERSFSLYFSNIIILVLANMAIFGSIIYIFTWRKKCYRIAILPFIMGILLSSNTEGSWAQDIMQYSPIPWMYNFYYLKYLFIVIPGSIAGEYLKEWLSIHPQTPSIISKRLPLILLISISVIIINVYCLYTRQLLLNLIISIILLFTLYILLRKKADHNFIYWRKLFVIGAYLIMLGLCFEAFEGGIRKDHSTFSYYFLTSGLAFMAMIALSIICDIYRYKIITRPFEMVGQNPMIAYVAPQLVITPIIGLLGLNVFLNIFNQNAYLGFIKGLMITALSIGIASFFTYKKYFWRT